jgi:hypothetical protein
MVDGFVREYRQPGRGYLNMDMVRSKIRVDDRLVNAAR